MVLIGLLGDAPLPTQRISVAYVGTATPQSDPTFQRFLDALERLPSPRRDGLGIDYLAVRDGEQEAIAEDLRRTKSMPDLWVAPTGTSAPAVLDVDHQHPLVFASFPDPVRIGLVQSLSRPGGRATGIWLDDDLHAKRLELLKDAFPSVHAVGVLVDRLWIENVDVQSHLVQPAAALGLQLTFWTADELEEVDRLMSQPTAASMDAWYIPPTYIAYRCEAAIIGHIRRLQRPSIHGSTAEVEAGALMAYSLDTSFVFDALTTLVVRLAAGADPSQIPVQRPRKYVLSVRPREAPPDMVIAPAVVLRADRIF